MWQIKIPSDPCVTRQVSHPQLQVQELVTLSCEEVEKQPVLHASVKEDMVMICVDEQVILFNAGTTASDVLNFGHQIEMSAWSPDGTFLLLALANGALQLIYTPGAIPIINRKAVSPVGDAPIFTGIYVQSEAILVLTRDGRIFRFFNVQLDGVKKLLDGENLSDIDALQEGIKFEEINAACGIEVSSAALWKHYNVNQLIVATEDCRIMQIDLEMKIMKRNLCTESKSSFCKLIPADQNGVMFGLTACGCLHVFRLHLLITGHIWCEETVQDFALLGEENEENLSLLLLLKERIEIRSYPGFCVEQSVTVNPSALLPSMLPGQDRLFFLEGRGDEDSDFVTEISVQEIVEGTLEMRLEKLLHYARFTEAEDLAIAFNLNVEHVLKEAAMYKLTKCSTTSCFPELLSLLDRIEDAVFVVEECASTFFPSLETTRELWLYAENRCQELEEKGVFLLSSQLKEKLYLLETIKVLWEEDGHDAGEFYQQFCSSNPASIFQKLLNERKLEKAILIWKRHPSCQDLITSVSAAESLLIPTLGFSCASILNWLEVFLTSVAAKCIEAVPRLMSLILERAKDLELKDPVLWPVNALKFLEAVLGMLKIDETGSLKDSATMMTMHRSFLQDSVFQQTGELIIALRELETLNKKFHARVSLSDYLQQDTMNVVGLLLDSVLEEEKIPQFVTLFLGPYVKKRKVEIENALLHYLQEVICTDDFSDVARAFWEDRVLSIYSCVKNLKIKGQCILNIVQKAPVPWSEKIVALAETGITFPEPIGEEVALQKNLVKIKLIMTKYGKWNFNVGDVRQSEIMVQYILSHGNKEDALIISRFTKCFSDDLVYALWLERLVQEGNEEAVKELVKTLPENDGKKSCRRFLSRIVSKLHLLTKAEKRLEYTKLCDLALPHLTKWLDWEECDEWTQFLETLSPKDIMLLFSYKFIMNLRGKIIPATVRDKCVKFSMEDILQDVLAGKELSSCHHKIVRLAYVFKLPPNQLAAELMLNMAKSKKLSIALEFLRFMEPLLPSQSVADIFCEVLPMLLTYWLKERDQEQLTCILNVVKYACAYCSADYMVFTSWTSSVCQLLVDLGQGEILSLQRDPYEEWTFSSIHQDIVLAQVDYKNNPLVNWLIDTVVIVHREVILHKNQVPLAQKNVVLLSVPPFDEITRLLHSGQDLLALRALETFNTIMVLNLNIKVEANSEAMMEKLASVLLEKLIRSKEPDLQLAHGIIQNIALEKAQSLLTSGISRLGSEPQHLLSLSWLGIQLHSDDSKGHKSCLEAYEELWRRAAWGSLFNNMHLDDIGAFLTGRKDSTHILKQLVSQSNIDLNMIYRFCADFKIDANLALAKHLRQLLLDSWFDINDSSYCDKMQHVLDKAQDIWKELTLTTDSSFLFTLLFKVSPYKYEVLSWIMENLQGMPSSPSIATGKILQCGLPVLAFIKNYRRRSSPKELELASEPDGNLYLQKMAAIRLPFHKMLKKEVVWEIVAEELTLDTISLWLQMVLQLKLQVDTLCMQAVQNSVQECLEQGDTDSMNKLMPKIEKCVQRMKDVEMAMACVNAIANKLPLGSAKVQAAQLCVKLADAAARFNNNSRTKTVLEKMNNRLKEITIEYILHTHGLTSENFLELTSRPKELLRSLYKNCVPLHCSMTTIMEISALRDTVRDVANHVPITLEKYQMLLLEEWLQTASRQISDGQPYLESLSRINALLPETEENECQEYLLKLAGDMEAPSSKRLCSILSLWASPKGRYSLTSSRRLTEKQMLNELKNLYYSVLLGTVHVAFSPESLQVVSKEAVVWNVWRAEGNSPKVLSLLLNFTLDFDLQDPKLWCFLFKQLKSLGMSNLLSYVKKRIPAVVHKLERDFSGNRL